MSINLLDLVKDQVTGQLVKQASGFLGESESGVQSALGGIMPTLLSGVINKASSPAGANGIMDIIGKLDLGGLSDIAGLFGGGQSSVNGLMNSGGGIVESLLGSKTSGVIDLIGKVSGLKSGSSSSLLKMAAPFLMSVIGKQVSGKGLGFLTDLLMGQKDHVAKALPAGMGSLLGFADMLGGASNAAKATVSSAANTVKNIPTPSTGGGGNNWLKWLLPLLIGAGLIWFLTKNGCNKKVEETMTDATEAVGDAANTATDAAAGAVSAVGDMLKSAFSQVDATAKAAFDSLKIEVGSAPEQIKNYIGGGFSGDPMFLIKNVNFASGSAELSKEAQMEVDHLAALLKAYPGVKIDIHGHTDNTGDAAANQKLSEARAMAVMMRLVGKGGIDQARLIAKGIGQDEPVADNATEEGRAKNRRIELKVHN